MEMIEDNLFDLLVNLFLLSKDDVSFALDRLRLELGILKDIGENVDGFGDVGVE